MHRLKSFDEVVTVFGGPAVLARMTSNRTSAVWNWRTKRGRFPSKFYKAMTKALAAKGFKASPGLWGQVKLARAKQ